MIPFLDTREVQKKLHRGLLLALLPIGSSSLEKMFRWKKAMLATLPVRLA